MEGFDVVLANPPYVRVHRLSAETKQKLWQRFNTFKAKADLYTCFIQRGIELARIGGAVSFICSDGWQRQDSYGNLRRYILHAAVPEVLLDLDFDVFEQAQVKVSVFLFRRSLAAAALVGHVAFARAAGIEDLGALAWTSIPLSHFRESYDQIFDTSWSKESSATVRKIRERSTQLGNLLDVCFGLKTGDDDLFVTQTRLDSHHQPLLRGENVGRYKLHWAGEYINYRPDQMRAHRSTARPGDRARFETEKVLVRDTSSVLECALDIERYYVKDVLIVRSLDGTIDPGYVAAMINSSLLRWYYERVFPTIHVQADELRSLPFINPSTCVADARRLSQLARARQQSSDPTAARKIEDEIDSIVLSLFSISDAETAQIFSELNSRHKH